MSARCPRCGGPSYRNTAGEPGSRLPGGQYVCERCGYGFAGPRDTQPPEAVPA